MKLLNQVLTQGLVRAGEQALAVSDSTESYSYGELQLRATQIAVLLQKIGVKAGDRVGLWCDKSCRALAGMLAVSKLNAVYVPIDPMNPKVRVDIIRQDCDMKVLITNKAKFSQYQRGDNALCDFVVLDEDALISSVLHVHTWQHIAAQQPSQLNLPKQGKSTDLAYMLYTSGSTGVPKGVKISHENALAFIEWSANKLNATVQDRFANHAPWHFDLSVLDIYVALLSGASVHLVSEIDSYVAQKLVSFVAQKQISVWYSVPTALVMMLEAEADFAERCQQLRAIIFAGEAFAIKPLKQLREAFPDAELYNFYGPTETNVCSYYKVPRVVPDKLPIGYPASNALLSICDEQGKALPVGEQGFVTVIGPTVFSGYWGRADLQSEAYNTGDIGYFNELGELMYVGRQDHMVKVNGYRVHLGEVERAIYQHPAVKECLVELSSQKTLHAHIAVEGDAPSLLTLKIHCAKRLPKYMLPEQVIVHDALPRNRNGKLSRQCLSGLSAQSGSENNTQNTMSEA